MDKNQAIEELNKSVDDLVTWKIGRQEFKEQIKETIEGLSNDKRTNERAKTISDRVYEIIVHMSRAREYTITIHEAVNEIPTIEYEVEECAKGGNIFETRL